jgi:hypothetical protein
MEKLGIANSDLLRELKSDYQRLKEKEASLIKEGSVGVKDIKHQLEVIKACIDENEKGENGRT